MQVDACANAHRVYVLFSGEVTTAHASSAELERPPIFAASSTAMRTGLSSS